MKYLLSYLLLFCSAVTSAQQLNISYSEEFKVVEHFNKNKVVKNSVCRNKFFYSATNDRLTGGQKWLFVKFYDAKYSLKIAKYDLNMNLVKEQKLENGDDLFSAIDPQLIQFGGKLLLGYYKPEQREFVDFYISIVNEETLQLSPPIKVLRMNVPDVGMFKLEDMLMRSVVSYESSRDDKKLLFLGMTDKNKLGIAILNGDLKVEKKEEMEVTGKGSYSIFSGAISNTGFTCVTLYSDKGDAKVLSFNNSGGKSEYEVSFSEKEENYSAIRCLLSKDESTVFLYSVILDGKWDDSKYCKGFWVTSIKAAAKSNSLNPVVYPFPETDIALICEKGGGNGKRKNKNVYNFIPQMKELDDGTLVFSGSPQYMDVDVLSSKTSVYTTTSEGSLLIFFVKPGIPGYVFSILPREITLNGGLSVASSVSNLTASHLSKGYYGAYIFTKGDSVLVIYDDNEKNANQPVSESTISTKSTYDLILTAAVITKKGEIISRKVIGQKSNEKNSYYVSEALIQGKNSLIIPLAAPGSLFKARDEFYNYWCFFQTNYQY